MLEKCDKLVVLTVHVTDDVEVIRHTGHLDVDYFKGNAAAFEAAFLDGT
jgi:hypothetical protein